MRLSAAVSVLFLLSACGPTSVTDAQVRATRSACDWYQECDKIGPGKDFEDRQECEVKTRDYFQAAWSEAQCAKIDEKGLDTCVDRIRTTSCTSGLDFVTTLTICSRDNVCTAE